MRCAGMPGDVLPVEEHPARASARTRPETARASVLLPAPLAPSTASTVPGCHRRARRRRAPATTRSARRGPAPRGGARSRRASPPAGAGSAGRTRAAGSAVAQVGGPHRRVVADLLRGSRRRCARRSRARTRCRESERTAATSCSTMMSESRWSVWSTICRKTASRFSDAFMSSPESGSSSRSTCGSLARARPTSTRRTMPSGSAATGAFATLVSRSSSSSPSTRSFSAVEGGRSERGSSMSRHSRLRRHAGAVGQHQVLAHGQPHEQLGLLERPGQPLRRPAPGARRWSRPRRAASTRPALGRSRPDSTASSVDLPAPLGPTRPAMLPGLDLEATRRRARSARRSGR